VKSISVTPITPAPWEEEHYTLSYLSEKWHLSRATVKRAVERCIERDPNRIVKIGGGPLRPGKKRVQTHWRIPRSLAAEVYGELTRRSA
jgi:hypothetical protein